MRRPRRLFRLTVPRPKGTKLRPRTARLRPRKTRTKMVMKTIRKKPIRMLTCPCLQKMVMKKKTETTETPTETTKTTEEDKETATKRKASDESEVEALPVS